MSIDLEFTASVPSGTGITVTVWENSTSESVSAVDGVNSHSLSTLSGGSGNTYDIDVDYSATNQVETPSVQLDTFSLTVPTSSGTSQSATFGAIFPTLQTVGPSVSVGSVSATVETATTTTSAFDVVGVAGAATVSATTATANLGALTPTATVGSVSTSVEVASGLFSTENPVAVPGALSASVGSVAATTSTFGLSAFSGFTASVEAAQATLSTITPAVAPGAVGASVDRVSPSLVEYDISLELPARAVSLSEATATFSLRQVQALTGTAVLLDTAPLSASSPAISAYPGEVGADVGVSAASFGVVEPTFPVDYAVEFGPESLVFAPYGVGFEGQNYVSVPSMSVSTSVNDVVGVAGAVSPSISPSQATVSTVSPSATPGLVSPTVDYVAFTVSIPEFEAYYQDYLFLRVSEDGVTVVTLDDDGTSDFSVDSTDGRTFTLD